MDPQIPTADSQGCIPVEVVSYSDSGWAGCQRSHRSTSGSWITLFSVDISSTSLLRLQYPTQVQKQNCMRWLKQQSSHLRSSTSSRSSNQRFFPRRIHQQAKRWSHVYESQEIKTHRAQTFVDSGCPQWRHHVIGEGWNTAQSFRCSHKVCSSFSVRAASSEAQLVQRSFPVSGIQVLLRCREGQDSRQESCSSRRSSLFRSASHKTISASLRSTPRSGLFDQFWSDAGSTRSHDSAI